jgi:hypothetical protein
VSVRASEKGSEVIGLNGLYSARGDLCVVSEWGVLVICTWVDGPNQVLSSWQCFAAGVDMSIRNMCARARSFYQELRLLHDCNPAPDVLWLQLASSC